MNLTYRNYQVMNNDLMFLYVISFNNYNLNYIIMRPYTYGALGYVDVLSRYF